MKAIVQIARVLTGLLFIFSGAIKLNDPSGFSIKLNEYFDVFSQDVSTTQDTLKISMMSGTTELGSKNYVLYSFDKQRELSLKSEIDTTQTTTTAVKIGKKKDTSIVTVTKVGYTVSVDAQLGGQSAMETEFELADSAAMALFNIKATIGGKAVFQKDYKATVGEKLDSKNMLNLTEYVKKESWLNGFFKSMKDYTLWLSIFVCALEVILGFALIVGWRIKLTAWLMFLLIVFFTFLTAYSWLSGFCPKSIFWMLMGLAFAWIVLAALVQNLKIRKYMVLGWLVFIAGYVVLSKYTQTCFACDFNPLKMKVTDCGCFGDFLHLEPKQSFFKDIILLCLILLILFGCTYIKPWFSKKFGWKFMAFITLISAGFGVFCYLFLPVWDFLPYKKGNNIKELIHFVPPGMRASDSVLITYVMHKGKDSVEIPFLAPYKEYSDKSKAGWKVGRRFDKVIIEGYKSTIHDFVITDAKTGMEMRDTFLENKDYQLFLSVPYLDKAYKGANKEIEEIYQWAKSKKIRFWAVSSSGPELADSIVKMNKFGFTFFTSDQKTLITIGRYNPTLYLYKGPVVVYKWSGRHLPSLKRLEKLSSK